MEYAPEWQAAKLEKLLGYRPKLEGDADNIFRQWAEIGADSVSKVTYPAPDPSVRREDRAIYHDEFNVRIYHPPGSESSSTYPLCVYIHGGGWILGDLEIEDGYCAEMCKRCSLVVVSIDYRLAPQHKFPAALDDCVAGYEWAVQNATSLGASTEKVLLAGGSAGGNLAIGTALRLIDKGSNIQPTALLALVPVTIDPTAVPSHLLSRYTSYEENHDTGPNTPTGMRGFIDAYGPDPHDQYFSVLLHDKLGLLPKAYVAICGKDTLRDDGRLFVEALKESGVPVHSKEYQGFPHYFWTWPVPSLKEINDEFLKDCVEETQWLLAGRNSHDLQSTGGSSH